jgi:immune inhibitor A
VVAICVCCGSPGWRDWEITLPTLPPSSPEPEPTPSPTADVKRDPPGDLGSETEALLETTIVPVRDLHDLAIRLSGLSPDTPRTINPEGPPDYSVGDRRLFHVSNADTDQRFDIHAVLEYSTEHVYMWVEEGVAFDRDGLEAAADLFETHTYVTDRAFFGSEWMPGVDNDPHLSILHSRGLGFTIAAYYTSRDEFVSHVCADSNEMEMFYVNVDSVTINDEFYNGVLAHEFQHMIHWYQDRNEDTWLNEGFSELASYLNGFDVGGFDWLFAQEPDMQLNSWPDGPGEAGANYGAAYLFTTYFLDRYGPEATQALVAHQENSFSSVDAVLVDLGTESTHEDLFADWVVANLLDAPGIADGQYGYQQVDPPDFHVGVSYSESDYPVSESATVHQYGTDYLELQSSAPLVVRFTGSTQVGLVDTTAHSGSYAWWSNRGDDSNMTLTRAFDLSNVSEATLEYWVWYDIEEDWDYAYLEVSSDNGQSWQILETPSGTDSNPNGSSFGWGYTGASGSGFRPEWILERIDLSSYAGQEVLVRFEYVTDDAVNKPGLLLDDMAIPEAGYAAHFETSDGGWESSGFIRHANVLPQRWLVQLILFGDETTVQRLELSDEQAGEWTIPLGDGVHSRAVIAVSALAPVTTELGSYTYGIEMQPGDGSQAGLP